MFNESNGGGLDMVKVNKETLLAALRENLKEHIAEFEEAMEGFKAQRIKDLQKYLREAKKEEGNVPNHISFSEPESHEDDYTTVISMLEMSVDEEVHVTMHEFQKYVEDNWSWKKTFEVTNALYKSK